MAVFLQSLSPPEKDWNSPHQGRTPTLPRGAQGRPRGGQAAVGTAACGTGHGQTHRKGMKG